MSEHADNKPADKPKTEPPPVREPRQPWNPSGETEIRKSNRRYQ